MKIKYKKTVIGIIGPDNIPVIKYQMNYPSQVLSNISDANLHLQSDNPLFKILEEQDNFTIEEFKDITDAYFEFYGLETIEFDKDKKPMKKS